MALKNIVKLINTRGMYKHLDTRCIWFREVRYAWRSRDRYVCLNCGACFTLDRWYRRIIDSLYCPRCNSTMIKVVGAGSWTFADYVFRMLLRDFVSEFASYKRVNVVTVRNKKYIVDLVSSEVVKCEEEEKESHSIE